MDKVLIRASSAGAIMPAPTSKVAFTDTCTGRLIEIYNSCIYNRTEDFGNKYTENGLDVEEDSITLFSRVKKTIYSKNKKRAWNDYTTGEWDLHFLGADNTIAETVDIKSNWSKNTFDKARLKAKLNTDYYWQGVVYMWLTGAKKHTVAYCLTNASERTILDEKRRLAYKLGVIDMSAKLNDDFVAGCKQIEINHIFDLGLFVKQNPHFDLDNSVLDWRYDIPMEERVCCFTFERNEADIERLRLRIIECRLHLENVLFKK